MKKFSKMFIMIFAACIFVLPSNFGFAALADDADYQKNYDYDPNNYVGRHIDLLYIDVLQLKVGTTTDAIYLGDGQWGTRTITVTPLTLDSRHLNYDEQGVLPAWWCCGWPNFHTFESVFDSCGGWNMAGCTLFRRTTITFCSSCGTMFADSIREVTLPGCFFAFYGELGWRYPLTSRHINSGYGVLRAVDGWQPHTGIDVIRPPGTGSIRGERIYAAHSGTVAIAGFSSTAGYWVVIRSHQRDTNASNNFIVSRYLHMLNRPSHLQLNSNISQGAHIGLVGNSGSSHGYHLHLDFNNQNRLDGVRGATLNPQRFFPYVHFTGESNRNNP